MSADWLSQPLSIKSIASQYPLPVVIRPALGLRGSDQPIILHSIASINFAFGRALKKHQSRKSEYQSFKPIDSEIVAIPLRYTGYFECLLPTSRGPEDGVLPEKSIRSIVERMQNDMRPQIFYIGTSLRAYTLERKSNGHINRSWQQFEAHQNIFIEQLTNIEYTPTEKDNLTDDDYGYAWLFCIPRRILNRREYVMKCILANETICYIPCSSTDEVCLYPVGQRGSTNVYKLHTVVNLLEQFSLPLNIKLAQFPGFETYRDFGGYIQLLGSQTKEFAICASLSSTNISLVTVKTPLKFVVTSIPLTSDDIINQLSRCQIFIQSFDKQIRRVLISSHDIPSHRSRSKHQNGTSKKRSSSAEQQQQQHLKSDDQMALIEDDSRQRPSTEKKRSGFRKQRAISTSADVTSSHQQLFRRTLSTDDNEIYNSLIHPVRSKSILKAASTLTPTTLTPTPSLSKKRSHCSRSPSPFTYDTGINLSKDLDLPDADGAILLEHPEIFPPVKTDNRLS